jgi:peroxiredoxin
VTSARNQSKRERREQARIERQRQLRRAARKRKLRGFGIALVSVAVIGGVGFALVRSSSTGVSFSGDIRAGGVLKSLRLPALESKAMVDYTSFRSKPLVLNFFASWCPNCAGEMPGFQQVHQQLGSKVAFLGVSQSDSRGGSIHLAEQTGVKYPLAYDQNGTFYNATGSTGMPTTLFIRPGGQIAYIQVGALDPTSLRQEIAQYLSVQ